jgi:hypothetical protein
MPRATNKELTARRIFLENLLKKERQFVRQKSLQALGRANEIATLFFFILKDEKKT